MEVSGNILKQVTYIAGAQTDNWSLSKQSVSGCESVAVGGSARIHGMVRGVRVSSRPRMLSGVMGSGFCDNGYLHYYQAPTTRCGVKSKQKRSGVLTTKKKDVAKVLMKQLQQLRAEEKEIKRKRKREKVKLKARRIKIESSSSSSSSSESESSDSDCEQVVDMSSLRTFVAPAKVDELQQPVEDPSVPIVRSLLSETQTGIEGKPCEDRKAHDHAAELCARNDTSLGSTTISLKDESNVATPKRIEVCMGKKCERSGAAALLQEFQKVVGVEGAVVGCKCMRKCRSAPNVRVHNSVGDGSANPLYVRVGLEDVANFFHNNLGYPAPTM